MAKQPKRKVETVLCDTATAMCSFKSGILKDATLRQKNSCRSFWIRGI